MLYIFEIAYNVSLIRSQSQKLFFVKLTQDAGNYESQGPSIRVGEMRRERYMEGMPGLLLVPSIDVTSASLDAKKQESAIE